MQYEFMGEPTLADVTELRYELSDVIEDGTDTRVDVEDDTGLKLFVV